MCLCAFRPRRIWHTKAFSRVCWVASSCVLSRRHFWNSATSLCVRFRQPHPGVDYLMAGLMQVAWLILTTETGKHPDPGGIALSPRRKTDTKSSLVNSQTRPAESLRRMRDANQDASKACSEANSFDPQNNALVSSRMPASQCIHHRSPDEAPVAGPPTAGF